MTKITLARRGHIASVKVIVLWFTDKVETCPLLPYVSEIFGFLDEACALGYNQI